jgi:2'-hydroxyisoflavone reductase
MKLLILGGTRFVGLHLAREALAAGHELTLFNRGNPGPALPAEVEQLHGDRRGDLAALRGRRWDAVLDPACYLPSLARRSAELLRDAVEHYVLVSTISVYPQIEADTDEDSELATLSEAELAAIEAQALVPGSAQAAGAGGGYGAAYGGLKVGCERAVQALFGERALIVRPGFIVGPHDYSPRLRYWLQRMQRAAADGEPVLAPGRPGRTVRMIDARDIAGFCLDLAAQRRGGVFNLVGADGLSMGGLLRTAQQACGAERAELRWLADQPLQEAGVQPFVDLPYWLPEPENGLMALRNRRAEAAGLRFRPLAETLADTVAQLRSEPPLPAQGLDRQREQALLRAHTSLPAPRASP